MKKQISGIFVVTALALVLVMSFSIIPTYAASVTEIGDAGSTLATAQDISNIPVNEITGEITVDSYTYPWPAVEWDLDIYKIYINDPATFSATTLNDYTNFEGKTSSGDRDDTMLFLLDENGYAVCMNDNTPRPGYILPYYESTIPANDPLGPTSPGIYYLAITGYNRLPYDQNGFRIFETGSHTIVLGPSLAPGPVSFWSYPYWPSWYPDYFNFGDYKIILTGVGPSNLPPVADADGPYAVDEGDTVTLDASGSSDPDDNIVLYEWDTDNDGQYDDATGVTTDVTFDDNGSFTVGLKVTDDYGESDTDTAEVSVYNVAPVVDAGNPKTASEGETVAFTGNFTDPGTGDTHTFTWDFGDGGDPVSGTLTPSHIYADDGAYTATLEVTDDDGGTSTDDVSVAIGNLPPVVDVMPNQTINLGDSVSVHAGFSDPGIVDIHTATIFWGDGSSGPGTVTESNGSGNVTGSHEYTWPGSYVVLVEVSDYDGGVGSGNFTCDVFPVLEVMLETLSDDMEEMGLPEGTEESLNASLDTANKVLKDSNPKNDIAAINTLKAFINKVEAQRGKKISGADADALTAQAQAIIDEISGGS
jgi:PKD repeat protein